jgi:hypothetical protein
MRMRRDTGRPWPARLLGATAVLACAFGPPLAAAEPLPYTLAIHVRYVDAGQSASLREQVERSLQAAVRAEGCYRDVRVVPPSDSAVPDTDLLLRVSLGDVQDETEYDQSLAGFVNPDDPYAKLAYTVTLSTQVIQELLALPSQIEVRRSHFTARGERRPFLPDEDVRGWARDQMVKNLTREVSGSVCGSRRKLQKKVEEARAAGSASR